MRKLIFGVIAAASISDIAYGACPSGSSCQGFATFVTGLSSASTLAGTELIPCIQSSATVSCTPAQIQTYLGLGTFATQNYATPPAIGATTAAAGHFTTLSASSTVSGTGFSTYLASPPAIGGTAPAAGAFTTLSATGALTTDITGSTQCVQVNSSGVLAGSGGSCGGSGSVAFEVNGSALSSSSTVNFENSSATNGVTYTFANPSAGNVQLGVSGTLNNAGLTNSAVTVNGQSISLGSSANVNSGSQYSIALNGASGAQLGGVGPCTTYQIVIGQGASANPICASTRTPVIFTCSSVSEDVTDYCVVGIANASSASATQALTPISGSLRNLYVYTADAPASGQTFAFTIQLGSPGGTLSGTDSLTCTVTSSSSQTCSDTSDNPDVTAGNAWQLKMTTSATSGATGNVMVAFEYDNP